MSGKHNKPWRIWVWLLNLVAISIGILFFTRAYELVMLLSSTSSPRTEELVRLALWVVAQGLTTWLLLIWAANIGAARLGPLGQASAKPPATANANTQESSSASDQKSKNEHRRRGPSAGQRQAARDSLRERGSGRAAVDAEVAAYRRDDPDFVPDYPLDPAQATAIGAVAEDERGGFSVRWDDDFKDDDEIEDILSSDSRVISVKYEEGRWYSNGESGPPYYQFHVGCLKTDEDAIKADLLERGKERLGDAINDVTVY